MGFGKSADGDGAIVSVAFATALSRVAGFFRDSVMFALLGFSPWSGAFLFAFTLPNLFRRMLGEGALNSAMIPIFAETLEKKSRDEAFAFLNGLFCRLGTVIFAVAVVFLAAFVFFRDALPENWLRALGLAVLLFPYLAFACLSALLCGALNSLGSFGLPALNAALLNCAMIVFGALGLALYPSGGGAAALMLCGGVLVGGLLQLALPFWLLRQRGWLFRFDFSANPLLGKLMGLFVPATVGAAMVQINGALSRILAFLFTDNGMEILYMSSRLVELPLGIFAASVIAVSFPGLSSAVAAGDGAAFAENYGRAQRSLLAVTIPSALGLILLAKPILTALFAWGNCAAADLGQVLPALRVSAAAIPFFAAAGMAVKAFHAKQDMASPLAVAALSILINIILTLSFIGPFGATGIAAANSISALLQCILLQRKLKRAFPNTVRANELRHNLLPLLLASLALSAVIFICGAILGRTGVTRLGSLTTLIVTIPAAATAYVAVLSILHFEEVSLLLTMVKPRKRSPFSR